MNILEWDEIGRAVAISALAFSGWLITVHATYLLFRSTIKDNNDYIKDLSESLKALK